MNEDLTVEFIEDVYPAIEKLFDIAELSMNRKINPRVTTYVLLKGIAKDYLRNGSEAFRLVDDKFKKILKI